MENVAVFTGHLHAFFGSFCCQASGTPIAGILSIALTSPLETTAVRLSSCKKIFSPATEASCNLLYIDPYGVRYKHTCQIKHCTSGHFSNGNIPFVNCKGLSYSKDLKNDFYGIPRFLLCRSYLFLFCPPADVRFRPIFINLVLLPFSIYESAINTIQTAEAVFAKRKAFLPTWLRFLLFLPPQLHPFG